MLLLHTSDWHLGQSFHEFDRHDEHERFLAWLLDTMDAEQPDALLVAGDVFDHANPSAASQRQLYRFLTGARRRHPRLDIVLIAGNHDSPGRLEAPSPLFEAFGITVVGQVVGDEAGEVDIDRLLVPLHGRSGEVEAWLIGVPFVRSSDLPAAVAEAPAEAESSLSGAGAQTRHATCDLRHTVSPYSLGVARLYQQAIARVVPRLAARQAIVALGHCHVAGGTATLDSERPILAAALDALGPEVFDPRLAYVALGHFHKAQAIAGDERIRYAGSPLPLSFSETDYPHQVVRVELDGDRLAEVCPLPVPPFVRLLRVPTVPAPADDVVAAISALDLPDVEERLRPYLEVRVRVDGPEPGLRARVEAALAGKPVRLARIETSQARDAIEPGSTAEAESATLSSLEDLARLQPDAVFRAMHRRSFGCEPSPELLLAFGELLREPAEEVNR